MSEIPTKWAMHLIRPGDGFPLGVDKNILTEFLTQAMQPYADTPANIRLGLDDAMAIGGAKSGFIVLAMDDTKIMGAVVVVTTGMKGYIPENVLLFAGVKEAFRDNGIGEMLITTAIEHAQGDVKLHVEHDSPAIRLYERLGFTSKYREMRFEK